MSIEEQIAHLESEKRTTLKQYESQINALRSRKQQAEDQQAAEEEVVLPGGRRVIRVKGKPVSQIILDDRGSY